MNREDDYQARKHGGRWAARNRTWVGSFQGIFWHPAAYAELKDCKRDLTKVPIYAAACHERLMRESWGPAGLTSVGVEPQAAALAMQQPIGA